MDKRIYVEIEEYINARFSAQTSSSFGVKSRSTEVVNSYFPEGFWDNFEESLNEKLKKSNQEEKLYDLLLKYIKRSKKNFYKKNGTLNGESFCKYVYIDKSTWSNIQYDIGKPSKETLLKLIIALELNEEEAQEVLNKGGRSFCYSDFRDQLILAIIDKKIYDIETVFEILEKYRNDGVHKFENIY